MKYMKDRGRGVKMKSIFSKIIIVSLLINGFILFSPINFVTAQPDMVQPGAAADLSRELLEAFPLPTGPISENDIPRIKIVISRVLNRISESIKASGQVENGSDVRPIMSAVLVFQDWLIRQGCVRQASNWYVRSIDDYNDDIFLSYPGQVPFDILFDMQEGIQTQNGLYRLLIFVTTVDYLRFASLAQNQTVIVWPGEDVPYLVPSNP